MISSSLEHMEKNLTALFGADITKKNVLNIWAFNRIKVQPFLIVLSLIHKNLTTSAGSCTRSDTATKKTSVDFLNAFVASVVEYGVLVVHDKQTWSPLKILNVEVSEQFFQKPPECLKETLTKN